MTKDDLLRLAYELLWHEHRITSVEVGEAFEINETYHKDSCDVCDLLKEIDESLEPVSTSVILCCTVDCTETRPAGIEAFRNHECKCTCKTKRIWPERPVD